MGRVMILVAVAVLVCRTAAACGQQSAHQQPPVPAPAVGTPLKATALRSVGTMRLRLLRHERKAERLRGSLKLKAERAENATKK